MKVPQRCFSLVRQCEIFGHSGQLPPQVGSFRHYTYRYLFSGQPLKKSYIPYIPANHFRLAGWLRHFPFPFTGSLFIELKVSQAEKP